MKKSKLRVTAPVLTELNDGDKMIFGVHEGKIMMQVPPDYLAFIYTQDWIKKYPTVRDYIKRSAKAINMELRDLGKEHLVIEVSP